MTFSTTTRHTGSRCIWTTPLDCWCRLDVVPDAGASTVSLTVGGIDGVPAPDVLTVRDAWVTNLNAVDWPDT